MRVCEEPFLSRRGILGVLRPGGLSSESPFRTLRQGGFASEGLRVDLRSTAGRFLGQMHVYSSLNADAARAVRLREHAIARRFAARARDLEQLDSALLLHEAVQSRAVSLPSDPLSESSPVPLQRYAWVRSRFEGRSESPETLMREWLTHPDAWVGEADELAAAAAEVASFVEKARAEILPHGRATATTFLGVVRRMDEFVAEIEGESGRQLISVAELRRHGLAAIDQPVALLCERLPAGGTLVIPMPAVALPEGAKVADELLDIWRSTGTEYSDIVTQADLDWIAESGRRSGVAVPVGAVRWA